MVFASTCEHASSAFIFTRTSSDQICLASSEHFKKIQMASSEHFVNFLGGIYRFLFTEKKCFTPCNLADSVESIAQQHTANCALLAMMSNYIILASPSAVHWVDAQRDPKISKPTL